MTDDELVERLRDADQNSQQRILGSRIFGEAADAVERLTRERDQARHVVRETLWMAGRYADGRQTYAVSAYNDAVALAKSGGYDNGAKLALDGQTAEWPTAIERAEAAEARVKVLEKSMTREKIIEYIATAAVHFDNGGPSNCGKEDSDLYHEKWYDWVEQNRPFAASILNALCAAIPGLSEVIDSKAVIVPKEQ